jgi:hypothetical protein
MRTWSTVKVLPTKSFGNCRTSGLPALPGVCEGETVAGRSSVSGRLDRGFQRGPLDTLAQLPPIGLNGVKNEGGALYRRARAKYLTKALSTALADHAKVAGSELEKGYRNSVYCGEVITQTGDKLVSRYCGNRWCVVCGRIRIARAIGAYREPIEGLDRPQFVTLTVRNVGADELPSAVASLQADVTALGRWMREKQGVRFQALRKLECTYSPRRGDFHPHLHLVVDGGPDVGGQMVERWLSQHRSTAVASAQDVRPLDQRGLTEVFKYFSKLTCPVVNATGHSRRVVPVAPLDVIFRSMRGRRVFQPMGLAAATKEDAPILDEEEELGVLSAGEATKRLGEHVLWMWEQEAADWLDHSTGEALTGYLPSEPFQSFVEGIIAS